MTAAHDLQFHNGFGGFNAAKEYELTLSGDELPPAPWINVIANESGGFIVSEAGAGPIWAINSSQFRLTPWHNDPVCDRPGDCIYLRDDGAGEVWTATPAPIRESSPYSVRHGAGYSVFEHSHNGIETSLRVGVPTDDPVKLQLLTVTNTTAESRSLTIATYVEWVLGTDRETTRFQLRTWHESGVILAQNEFDPEFAHMTAFAAMSTPLTAWTRSRREFLGRNGSLAEPRLSSSDFDGNDADPCAVLETRIELEPGQ
jgi:cyclic beta-1,2-glucan synthetase